MSTLSIDLFCRVIDNHGDLGVCWRLATLLQARGHSVRLFVDDDAALSWMAPQPWPPGIEVCPWDQANEAVPRGAVIETFGCELPAPYQAKLPQVPGLQWINLEYLSAEDYVERSHGLRSPVMSGPAKGLWKTFCYPGFTTRTGGLMRGFSSPAAKNPTEPLDEGHRPQALLFCYEPEMLGAWLAALRQAGWPCGLRVAPGRPARAVSLALAMADHPVSSAPRPLTSPPPGQAGPVEPVTWLAHTDQPGFDDWLRSARLNIVRGEDSFVRAQWAGRPFVWHIYPQEDGVHLEKLEAFLARFLDGMEDLVLARHIRDWHLLVNGALTAQAFQTRHAAHWPWPAADRLDAWQRHCERWRERLLTQADLCDTVEKLLQAS